jgi:hypothetical protein
MGWGSRLLLVDTGQATHRQHGQLWSSVAALPEPAQETVSDRMSTKF